MLTANRLRKVLSYAPATGIFRWKVSASTRAPVGTIAGSKNGRGYHQIRIGGRPYSASRLAWLYIPASGRTPKSAISTVSRLTRGGKTFRKQHRRQIAALRGNKLKRLRLERSENHVRFPPKADIRWRKLNVRFGSKADMCSATPYVR